MLATTPARCHSCAVTRPGLAAPCTLASQHIAAVHTRGSKSAGQPSVGIGLQTAAGRAPFWGQSSRGSSFNTTCHAHPVAALATAGQAATPWAGIVFSHVTVTMVLAYGLMVFAGRSSLTNKVMRSSWLLLLLGSLYIASLTLALQSGLWQSLVSIFEQVMAHPQHIPDVAAVGKLFTSPLNSLTSWIHLMMLDFYQARQVWLDGMQHNTPTTHSIILCFFVGPLGLLSHAITRKLTRKAA